jgi:hypothetical protein
MSSENSDESGSQENFQLEKLKHHVYNSEDPFKAINDLSDDNVNIL